LGNSEAVTSRTNNFTCFVVLTFFGAAAPEAGVDEDEPPLGLGFQLLFRWSATEEEETQRGVVDLAFSEDVGVLHDNVTYHSH